MRRKGRERGGESSYTQQQKNHWPLTSGRCNHGGS